MGHESSIDPPGEHIGNVSNTLEGHLRDLASPETPKAIEAIHAEITFATLQQILRLVFEGQRHRRCHSQQLRGINLA